MNEETKMEEKDSAQSNQPLPEPSIGNRNKRLLGTALFVVIAVFSIGTVASLEKEFSLQT